MNTKACISQLTQFRETLYQKFNHRADTLMELLDALASNPQARSVVEYSLTPCFRRSYSTLFKAIAEMNWEQRTLPQLLAEYLPRPTQRSFWLLGVDVSSQPRPYAGSLADRSMVYQPQIVKGNKPVTIGHQYSTVALLPEAETGISESWVIPLMTRRVHTQEDKEMVGAEQMDSLLKDPELPFQQELCVEVGDSSYSKPAYLHAHRQQSNLVTLVRVRNNRRFYRQPGGDGSGVGHPSWYGEAFSLPDDATWHPADERATLTEVGRRGQQYRIEIEAWHNMLMRGKRKPQPLPMQRYPFTLVRIVRYDQAGKLACRRPLWLIVVGEQRESLTLLEIAQAYDQRFKLEHFFRFGKQKLSLVEFRTPQDEREENWWKLVHIAYAQLWLARHAAQSLPRPWERNLPAMKTAQLSPTLVQRDWGRIIRQLGTPAQAPKLRGYSPGRAKGSRLTPRPRYPVVIKGQLRGPPP